ncbi:hypothetical protein CDL12_10390 [Handroanthus impetiginosus]|uniref:C2H2-type domain-containing protein n=1 Tax=Handroanthus impetiginosus TaxID=429701 RepID=A0A2G9HHH1_9LAMI|nr:hypothetical protein CDL12_10390 [Handroanthus impetiginosus]
MVNNQEADIMSLSIEKGKQKVDEFALWAKLEIPKEEGPEEEEGNMDIGDDQKIGVEINNGTQRVCQFCHKVFNSGKALGGHMRIHVQPANKKDPVFKARQTIKSKEQNSRDEKVKKTTCIICGKDFPSMKSLFGHMRCHPERDWRGINPPSNTSSSSSSLSEIDDDDKKLPSSRAVDLMESLSGWTVTARRGRKSLIGTSSSEISSLEDDIELLDAVNDLMMLSRGDPRESGRQKLGESEGANSFCKDKDVEKADQEMLEDLEQNYFSDDDQMDSKDQGMNDTNTKILVNNNKKKRKKMKLCDLEMDKNGSPVTSDKYKCSTCDKSFSTYQALGGHRSSHNKFTIVIRNSIEEYCCINPSNHPIAQVEENNKICSKNYSTTEGLGEGPSSTRQVPLVNDEAKSVLDFDLNELPPPEDETMCTWCMMVVQKGAVINCRRRIMKGMKDGKSNNPLTSDNQHNTS